MHIAFIEIANFRKLLSIRIDLATSTTLFVGANNSGKTSAILALRKFLQPHSARFETNDITLCHWPSIDKIGQTWLDARSLQDVSDLQSQTWANLLPALDLWLHVEKDELHHVHDLIPTLDWEGGLLGVRLRLEPKDLPAFYNEFLNATANAEAMKVAAEAAAVSAGSNGHAALAPELTIWPSSLLHFLSRRFAHHFAVRAYVLDPGKIVAPVKSQAKPQSLSSDALAIDGDPLAGLIRINEISAQRGFGEPSEIDDDDAAEVRMGGARLSNQLRNYYNKHLDPTDRPDPSDLGALQAIEAAQNAFDERLTESFALAFSEVEGMGYPGVTDPRPRVTTRLKAIDGLNHSASVTFEVDAVAKDGVAAPLLRLPEASSGLGYQNLISMIFRLMSFRDGWMRVGKAAKNLEAVRVEPLQLVLVEEPEAHLHAQVQQVFIKKAYDVLRAHVDLGKCEKLRTQLVVSTHSSHVAHEISFSCLRYFRRLPAGMAAIVPVSAVINLSDVFGTETETEHFVTRYLRAQHADLFFADAAILVEGPAERILLPNFIGAHYPFLNQCYVTLLEIGGSHAHRLRDLIQYLGLVTLIVTDLDSLDEAGGSAVPPRLGAKQVTNNATLKTWIPEEDDVDVLFNTDARKKVKRYDRLFEVRVAYQYPFMVTRPGTTEEETVYPYTFEDALAFENLEFFSKLQGGGLVRKFREAITLQPDISAISANLFDALRKGEKAAFALEIISTEQFETLVVPRYISEGLEWMERQLKKKQVEVLPATEGATK